MRTPLSELPGVSSLVKDYIDNFGKVKEFYNGDYNNFDVFQERAEELRNRELPLGKLASILKEQNQSYGCGFRTLENIDLLLERRACAVVTGQQVGLFSGPLYTIYKALSTIKLAARLNRTCEGCYVPVFWLASEDHDFREVNHVKIINKENQVVQLTYHPDWQDGRRPVFLINLDADINSAINELLDHTHPSEFKDEVVERLKEAYHPNQNFVKAFALWLTHLFKSYGLILIDGSDKRMKVLGRSIFKEEINDNSPVTQKTLETNQRLIALGYHAQVHVHKGLLNMFFLNQDRHTLEIQNGKFHLKGMNKWFTRQELIDLVEKEPQRFSPNVLMRPIYQDTLLPTVAYVAGPAEIAYYAQMKGIYEYFNLPMPIIYPRKSVTLVEKKVDKVLDSYNLKVSDFWNDVEQLINQIARENLPPSIEEKIAKSKDCIERDLSILEQEVTAFESTLRESFEVVKGKMQHQIDVLEKKILQAYKRRNEIVRNQIYKAKNNLYPDHNLQERELNIVPYLFKYGFNFIYRLYEALDMANHDHQIIRL